MERTKEQLSEDLRALRIDRRPRVSRESNSRLKLYLGAGLAAGAAAAAVFSLAPRVSLSVPFGLASAKNVEVVAAARQQSTGEAQPVLTASGYVIALKQVDVSSKITGRVVSLDVREGDRVRQGQVIARLDDAEFNAQVSRASASVVAARARLSQLQAGSRPQEIGRAKAEAERASADLKNAEIALRRTESLVKDGVIPQQSLDDARARYQMAQSTYNAMRESYELTQAGPRREEVDVAKAQLQQAEAELSLAQAQLQNTVIRSPISGVVLNRYVEVGAMVTTGFTSEFGAKQALVSVADMNDLQVELDIAEADIAKVQLGQPAVIVPDVYQDRSYQGTLEQIAAAANRQKASLQVKVKVLNPDEYLRSNMGVKVTFYQKGAQAPQSRGAVLVPKSALLEQGGRTTVFLVKEGKAVQQPVTVGRESGGFVEVLSGLEGGEQVVADGASALKDGDAVAVGR